MSTEHRREAAREFYFTVAPHERAAAAKGGTRSRHSGLTRAELAIVLTRQGGDCAICDVQLSLPLAVGDHDHRDGSFRGVLCGGCNTALGMMADSPARLRAAAEYLERHAERVQ